MDEKADINHIKTEEKILISDFYALKHLLKLTKELSKNVESGSLDDFESKRKLLLKKLKSGVFLSEERIEYKLSRNYKWIRKSLEKKEKTLPEEVKIKIKKILDDTNIFDAALKKLGARGGALESLIENAKTDPRAIKDVSKMIQDIIENVEGFEIRITDLINIISEFNDMPGPEKGFKTDVVFSKQKDQIWIHIISEGNIVGEALGTVINEGELSKACKPDFEKIRNQIQKIKKVNKIKIFEFHVDGIDKKLRGIGLGKQLFAKTAQEISKYNGILISGGTCGVMAFPQTSSLGDNVWKSKNWPSNYLKVGHMIAYLPGFHN